MPGPMTTVTGPCFHARMGRHEAADGAATHPLVADALQHRLRPGGHGAHSEALPGREGPIGWPVPEPDEGGEPVGWPGGLPGSPGSEQTTQDDGTADETGPPAPDEPRGWRRLLPRTRAA